ncbi:hypothetical protein Z517_02815 [Fonsecaea pedrosoi CBS 271.37]|uniref:Clr5 domain-containing protein n=1 Tax=Fonsecaea pedrosoi CBS 271.37 TaxID=1442368 RepID=A0A0D2GY78_9EURO|nr:uncharacterized protein Z517_02815 [Fonsecaea pedrosoi CBS 271.37]KIW83570.1 hypothetical protein Z517_02815 [Fonsecaea pedrosoi CBS 271.37]
MALISQSDIHMCDDSGDFAIESNDDTHVHVAAPLDRSSDFVVNQQMVLEDFAASSVQSQTLNSLPLRLRRPVIPSTVWERFRRFIHDLYIGQQLSLDEVRQRMKEQHNFDATEQMYKKRLRDWGLRKNYTQPQKLDAIKQLREAPSETRGNLPLRVNGVPLKERRLWRPVMRKRKPVILAPRPSPLYRGNPRSRLPPRLRTPSPQRLQLQLGSETQTIESLLRYTSSYNSWYLAQSQIKARYGWTQQLRQVFHGLRTALSLLRRNDSMAFGLMNRSCSGFHALLKSQPFQLMPEVLIFKDTLHFGSRDWEIRQSILKFFASLANTTLGVSHPITNFATLLLNIDWEHLDSCFGLYAELLLDQTKSVRDDSVCTKIQLTIMDIFRASGQFGAASRLGRRLWHANPLDNPVLTVERSLLIETAVRLAIYAGEYSKIEKFLMQMLSRSIVLNGKQNGDHPGIFACAQLGWLYCHMKSPVKSEKFFRLAIEGALQHGGFEVLIMLANLETVLLSFKMNKEAAQARIEYQHVWAQLDEWRLDRGSQSQTDFVQSQI